MAMRSAWPLLCLVAAACCVYQSAGTCVMFGICHKVAVGDQFKYSPCVKNYTEPQPLTDPVALQLLRDTCPDFAPPGVDAPRLCCNRDQVHILANGMSMPKQIFGRCPSCAANFVRLWCYQACAPNEEDFMHTATNHEFAVAGERALWDDDDFVLRAKRAVGPYGRRRDDGGEFDRLIDTQHSTLFDSAGDRWDATSAAAGRAAPPFDVDKVVPENGTWMTRLDFHISSDYAQRIWDSCKDVQFPGTNEPAVKSMCGTTRNCTARRWLDYLGDPALNVLMPFKINWIYDEEAGGQFAPLSVNSTPCDSAPDASSSACSCQDCAAVCAPDTPWPGAGGRQQSCYFVGVDCFTFLAALIFSGATVVICAVTVLQLLVNSRSLFKYASAAEGDDVSDLKDSLPDELTEENVTYRERFGYWFEQRLEAVFSNWGRLCCRRPVTVLLCGLLPALVCTMGVVRLRFTTDPVELWSAAGSRARIEKDHFDTNFGPFFRTEQLIVTPTNQAFIQKIDSATFDTTYVGPVFRLEFLEEVLRLQNDIASLVATAQVGDGDGGQRNVTLDDICYMPLYPDKMSCTIQSALEWFQGNMSTLHEVVKDKFGTLADFYDHMKSCIDVPTQVQDSTLLRISCLGSYGGPLFPYVVLGGFNDTGEFMTARGLVVTFVVDNSNNDTVLAMARAWEQRFIAFMERYESPLLNASFMAERSIQDEITRQSQSDVLTIVVSYLFMFCYIAFALGQYKVEDGNLCYLLVNSKVMLGVAGVVIVALSVTSSIGVYAWCGIPATMIILEVQPFLVLAVGVDNIFIFVQAYQRDRQPISDSMEDRLSKIAGEVIPTMLLSSLAEGLCFFLGALSSMPAVKVFSLYAAMAIFFDFFLQITCFLALFTLDVRRQESLRPELVCCTQLNPPDNYRHRRERDGLLYTLFNKYYASALLSKYVRMVVVAVFIGWMCLSLHTLDKIELGLDQKLSVPEDSYVLWHFERMERYLSVGPPVYFVLSASDGTRRRGGGGGGRQATIDFGDGRTQDMLCGSAGCDAQSLSQQLHHAAKHGNESYIAHPVLNWLDDYFDWLRPTGEPQCCRLHDDGSFCPATEQSADCAACNVTLAAKGRPDEPSFYQYLDDFLGDNPTTKCAKGGHAAYARALHFGQSGGGGERRRPITASYFMTYHTPLKKSAHFIGALRSAHAVSDNITRTLHDRLPYAEEQGLHVYPYSVFYVFYEQYETLVWDAVLQLLLSLSAIFLVTAFFLGLDPWSAGIVTVTIMMILVDLMAVMYCWSIDFNAISLVNLVMAIGISVEFCSHIVRAYAVSVRLQRLERAHDSLATMGSSVLSGITLTKFGGIVVLYFAHSRIFTVYYFRMYLGIVLVGAAHGLVWLPVLLSFAGPPVNKHKLLAWALADVAMQRHRFEECTQQQPQQQQAAGDAVAVAQSGADATATVAGALLGSVETPAAPDQADCEHDDTQQHDAL